MSLKFAGDVCVKSGAYQKDGQNRNRYLKLGAYFQDEKTGNIGILLQAVPLNMNVGKDGGSWLTLFPANNNNSNNQSNQNNNNEAMPF